MLRNIDKVHCFLIYCSKIAYLVISYIRISPPYMPGRLRLNHILSVSVIAIVVVYGNRVGSNPHLSKPKGILHRRSAPRAISTRPAVDTRFHRPNVKRCLERPIEIASALRLNPDGDELCERREWVSESIVLVAKATMAAAVLYCAVVFDGHMSCNAVQAASLDQGSPGAMVSRAEDRGLRAEAKQGSSVDFSSYRSMR